MTRKTSRSYVKGQHVISTVERILPFGVFVRLEDGTRAYIRQRELSWAGDAEPSQVVSQGQRITAQVIALGESRLSMELSYKATLPDPWQEFTGRYQERAVVTGTVKKLVPSGVFVELIPGVNGFIPLEELATWKLEQPEQVFWIADHVEAVVTRIDARRQRIALSIRDHLEQLKQADNLIQQLRHKTEPANAVPTPIQTDAVPEERDWIEEPLPSGDLEQIGSVLIVDDDDPIRLSLMEWLRRQGCSVDGTKTANEALECCQTREYGAVIADLDLPRTDGLGFLEQLRSAGSTVSVAVMSSPELIDQRLQALSMLHIAAAFVKPLDLEEIRHFLLQLAIGEKPVLSPTASVQPAPTESQPCRGLAETVRSGYPLAERLHKGLESLVQETRAEEGIIFHLDPVSQKVSIVTREGRLVPNEDRVYDLVDSPVKDVIVRRRAIRQGRVSQEHTGRFRKLIDFLAFESCLGVPIQAGGRTTYAVFLFHKEPDAFSYYHLRDARATAALFGATLEHQALQEHAQAMSGLFLSGQLAAAFGHEVNNKLSALDLQFRNLRSDFKRMMQQSSGSTKSRELDIEQGLNNAVEMALDLKRAVRGFRRLMEANAERVVDVNRVIRQATSQIRPLARRAQVDIRLELDKDLPPAAGSDTRLLQVLVNLMLNAVQHMKLKPGNRRVLKITAMYGTGDGDCPVEIRVTDTGPGIHAQLWDKIFALGFSTRPGGTGLGLFIARSLVESMKGQIGVEQSFIPLGTTFLLKLSATREVPREE